MTITEAQALLAQHPHHPTVTAQHLQKRMYRGIALQEALRTPVRPRPKRWGSIAQAIDHYLRTLEDLQH
jgi:hypothetical protein